MRTEAQLRSYIKLSVYCIDCGYHWVTESDYPVCPSCESNDIHENEDEREGYNESYNEND